MRTSMIMCNICLILAIAVLVGMMAVTLKHASYMWDDEGKSKNFNTFGEYYFETQRGALLIGIGTSFLIAAAGIFCYRKAKTHPC